VGDFLFRNLSVRLLPQGDAAADDRDVCVAGSTVCDQNHTCFDLDTCGPLSADTCTIQTCGDPLTNQVLLPEDPGQMRVELQRHIERLSLAQANLQQRAKRLDELTRPRTIEELDRLRAGLVDAIAELDEQRARLLSDQQPE
jgi:hypothetical protein